MNNKIIITLFCIIVLGAITIYTSSYVNKVNKDIAMLNMSTTSFENSSADMLEEYHTFEHEEYSSEELVHILPEGFDWGNVIVKLDQYEMNVGIEAMKTIEVKTKDEFPAYQNLPNYIELTSVKLEFSVPYNEYYKINYFLRKIQDDDQLIVIDEVSYKIIEDVPYYVKIRLLYFTYTTEGTSEDSE